MRAFLFLVISFCIPLYRPFVYPAVYPRQIIESRGIQAQMKRSEISAAPFNRAAPPFSLIILVTKRGSHKC